jgi:phosphatidylglycerophosphatase A
MSDTMMPSNTTDVTNDPHSRPRRVAVWVATLGGVGFFPKAPGTMGTLATLPLCIGAQQTGLWVYGVIVAAVIVLGWWSAEQVIRQWDRPDPKEVVIDEAAGILLTLWAVPASWPWWVGGFVLFRLFDIWKPGPVGWCDQNIKGGWGVMIDDVVAGTMAGAVLMAGAWMVSP